MTAPSKPTTLWLGCDVGGTKIAAGLLVLPEGRVFSRRTLPTLPRRGGEAVLEDVVRLAREFQEETARAGADLAGIGLGVCELVGRDGRLASAATIPWRGLPVCERLGSVAPAVMEADVRAAALAEATLGAGAPFRLFLYVTVGTGISCCLMVDGRPFLGARGATGTMASSPLSVPCERCDHVGGATLEEIASGPALVARFNARGGHGTSGPEVLAAAARGEPGAIDVVEHAAEALGSQVGLVVNVLDPEAVIVGGGLGLAGGRYWDRLIDSIRRHIWSEAVRDLPIRPAALGTEAGWKGAAIRAWADRVTAPTPCR